MDIETFKEGFQTFNEVPMSRGGQKEVYVAIHPEYGKVAVKRLFSTNARSDREIEIVQSNHFVQVPKIFSVEQVNSNGQAETYIIEEFIEGDNLFDIIKTGKRYDRDELVDFLTQGFDFVEQAWSKNIVHRDIKPMNIILGNDDRYYFLDFGIARIVGSESLTETGLGGPNSPGYAAPEVFLGDKGNIDTRADLFSLGVVAYELLTGTNPFINNANSNFAIHLNTLTVTPSDYVIAGDSHHQLIGLITSLMDKSLFGRPVDAGQARRWLESARLSFSED